MPKNATELPADNLYERDFYAWTLQQSQALEDRRWADIDSANVADEIRTLGAQVKREVCDRLEILMSYLLKWSHLAEYRGLAWKENIDRQRQEIAELFLESPSLSEMKRRFVAKSYENARRRLKYETYFFETDFPASCPFTVEQVFDSAFFPEERDSPATGPFRTARSIGR